MPKLTDVYSGPFPRKRHSHRCMGCNDLNSVACYKSQCSKPQRVNQCQYCRPLTPTATYTAPLLSRVI